MRQALGESLTRVIPFHLCNNFIRQVLLQQTGKLPRREVKSLVPGHRVKDWFNLGSVIIVIISSENIIISKILKGEAVPSLPIQAFLFKGIVF